ncbi:hypothetical protein PPYR_13667 [Photinus pyralis]|uniref:Major facilitator superfamily (MFS) profile domain-containing protein n=1 Tax=Photinus pyralis TaxID=7054 RepID=A0A5N4A9R1_PHOPY|nr:hypothetical protein PPYR_13667 [Photinus pyralis]
MIPARVELYILALLVITVTTFNLNVASTTIVSMVKEFYMRVPETDELNACHKRVNASTNNGGSLEWSGDVQFLFLTSPYLGYVVVQTLGGYATQRFGTKKVIGCSLLTISACNLVLPIGCKVHYSFAIVLQFVQGFAQGGIWPGLFGIIPYWIPLRERSRFGSCFQGSAIGAMSAQFIARLATPSIGWEYIFVVAAFVGLIMSLGWFLLACNEPELHPRITLDELDYIKKHQQVLPPYRDKIPWGSMVGSLPLWAILFSAFGRAWFGNTIGISGPLYLKAEIGLDDGSIGDFSGAIHFASFLTGLIFAYIADRLLIEDVVGVLANRRLLLGIGKYRANGSIT